MSYKNQAAWLPAHAQPLVVNDAPLWTPKAHEVLIENRAAAVNPVDWKIQDGPDAFLLKEGYPAILGNDVAGVIAAVGEGVKDFAVGDRVLAYASFLGQNGKPEYGGFQRYLLAPEYVVTKLPPTASFEEACVLPIALNTAALCLYTRLGLQRPGKRPDAALANKSLLVWGASSSVGSAGVQLAARAGYHVVATASAHNFEFVRRLGAAEVVDYRDPDVISKLKKAVKGEWVGAYDAICENDSPNSCAAVIEKGTVAVVIPSQSKTEGVQFAFAAAAFVVINEQEIGRWLYRDYLEGALADGSFQYAPQPWVFKGLERAQGAMDAHKRGVSAKKVVISLS